MIDSRPKSGHNFITGEKEKKKKRENRIKMAEKKTKAHLLS